MIVISKDINNVVSTQNDLSSRIVSFEYSLLRRFAGQPFLISCTRVVKWALYRVSYEVPETAMSMITVSEL